MTYTRLVLMAATPGQTWPYLTIDGAGMVVNRGVLSPQTANAANDVRTVLVVPGTAVTARWIELKATTLAQARAAASMMLEDDLGSAREALHIALGNADASGARLVCVASADWMREMLAEARGFGLNLEVVLPDYMMLPEPEGDTLQAADMGDVVAVRGRGLAFTAERELVALLAQGRPFVTAHDQVQIEGLLAGLAGVPPINLLQGAFAPRAERRTGWRDFRAAAVLAALVMLSPLILLGAQIAKDSMAATKLKRAAHEKALAITGPVEGDPIAALRAQAQARGAGERFVRASAVLFDAVADLQGASLQAFNYQADGAMRVTLIHLNYSDAESLVQAMRLAGYLVREDSATETDGRIVSDLTVSPLP